METIILGLAINLYTWSNADFFVARKNAERNHTCVWVDKGWSKADPRKPAITIFGYTRFEHKCTTKDK